MFDRLKKLLISLFGIKSKSRSPIPQKDNQNVNSVKGEELSEVERELLTEHFSCKVISKPKGTQFIHGGQVDFNFYPLSDKPIWLDLNTSNINNFFYGKSSGRKYVTNFIAKEGLKLAEFKLVDTTKLKLGGITRTDECLSLYIKELDQKLDGLIGPTGHVMLISPQDKVKPENQNASQTAELKSLVNKFKVKEIQFSHARIESGSEVIDEHNTYKLSTSMDVIKVSKESLAGISFLHLSKEEALYHVAKSFDRKSVLLDDKYLISAAYYENIQFIEKV
jgi:hypothetical protein